GGDGSSGPPIGAMGVPPERLMDWSVAGVPGGIPNRTTLCATVTSASQLQSAVDNCGDGQVVHVVAGTYTLTGTVVNSGRPGVVIGGAGPGKTIFKVSTGPAFRFGGGDWPPPQATSPILSGATRGSATITVQSTSGFKVGGLMKIGAGTNPPFVHNIGA